MVHCSSSDHMNLAKQYCHIW